MEKAEDYKISGKMVFLFVSFFFLVLYLICTVLTGFATISYNGFAFDRDGNLYLGKRDRVEVSDPEGHVIRTFRAMANLNFNFTISDDIIIMSAGDDLYWMDLSGNILEEELRSDRWQEFLPRGSENFFVDKDGTTYTMEPSGFFRTSIFRWDGEQKVEVFKMPLFDYITRLLFVVTVIDMFLLVGFVLGRENEMGGRLKSVWNPRKL